MGQHRRKWHRDRSIHVDGDDGVGAGTETDAHGVAALRLGRDAGASRGRVLARVKSVLAGGSAAQPGGAAPGVAPSFAADAVDTERNRREERAEQRAVLQSVDRRIADSTALWGCRNRLGFQAQQPTARGGMGQHSHGNSIAFSRFNITHSSRARTLTKSRRSFFFIYSKMNGKLENSTITVSDYFL